MVIGLNSSLFFRDPETIRRQEALAKKDRMDKDDEERLADFIKKQVERAKDQERNHEDAQFTEMQKNSEEEKGTLVQYTD